LPFAEQILSQNVLCYSLLTKAGTNYLLDTFNLSFFAIMSFFKRKMSKSRRTLKFSVEDPKNFKEVWSFNSNGFRVISLLILVICILAFLFAYLFSAFYGDISGNDKSIERKKLESQREEIELLTHQIENQERYVNAIKLILSGDVPVSSDLDSLYEHGDNLFDSISASQTENEIALADKVEDDVRMNTENDDLTLAYFSSPVVGVISQEYNKKSHPGIDVVTKKDEAVKACLAGTVIYSGYTRKDGYIVILDHSNGFISVYKHNKTVLKKMGEKVRLGDPDSIVGNTGENTDGPHLHFELWFRQSPVNPSDYIKFTK